MWGSWALAGAVCSGSVSVCVVCVDTVVPTCRVVRAGCGSAGEGCVRRRRADRGLVGNCPPDPNRSQPTIHTVVMPSIHSDVKRKGKRELTESMTRVIGGAGSVL